MIETTTPFVSHHNNAPCIPQLRLVAAFPGAPTILFDPFTTLFSLPASNHLELVELLDLLRGRRKHA